MGESSNIELNPECEHLVVEGSTGGLAAYFASFADMDASTIYETSRLIDAPWAHGEIEPEPADDDAWLDDLADERYREAAERELQHQPDQRHQPTFPAPARLEPYVKKPIHAKLRWAVFRRDGYRCVVCGCDEDLTADHIIAEVNGGKATIDNLQTLCRPCNSKKGVR